MITLIIEKKVLEKTKEQFDLHYTQKMAELEAAINTHSLEAASVVLALFA